MESLLNRFIRYVKYDTRSDESSPTIPSSSNQVEFARMLLKDLQKLGLSEVEYNKDNGFVTASLPANTDQPVPTIGFIAHMDTADFNSVNINPQVHENYDGKEIRLNQDYYLSPSEFPNLNQYQGHTLITTDGTTLLGADDKAGIVEIIHALDYFLKNPQIKHGKVRVAFGPDEEIGRGADHFDVKQFNADFAYTIDGGPVGQLQYECFNAAVAYLSFQGKNVHPGTAKGKMVNALTLAIQFDNHLPNDEVPELTEGRQGFYHLTKITGTVDQAQSEYLIRDHNRQQFNQRKKRLEEIVKELNHEFGEDRIQLKMKDQYYNMGEIIEKDMTPIYLAEKAMKKLGITVDKAPVRGGTDGSKISYLGLPTPNIFTGGENFHGRYEFISLESMEKAKQTIIQIIELAKDIK